MTKPSDVEATPALSASVQILPLPAGLYLFSVKSAASKGTADAGSLRVPAMHVGLGPGVRADQVEFLAGPSTNGAWLFAKEDLLITRVANSGATLVLTSVRAPGGEVLTIKVERLDNRADEPAAAAQPQPPAPPIEAPPMHAAPIPAPPTPVQTQKRTPTESAKGLPAASGSLPTLVPVAMHITAHIRTRGDMNFSNAPWAGRVAPGLWIESFSVRPLERFAAQDFEYKALTGSGFETPWLSDETMCGTKGLSVPLVGFAIRLKASVPNGSSYDCEYSGYFKSGITVGPVRNGAPCRSTVANDPLEGIQMRIGPRSMSTPPKWESAIARSEPQKGVVRGPSFGRYRDEVEPNAAGGSGSKPSVPVLDAPSNAGSKSNGVASSRRPPART